MPKLAVVLAAAGLMLASPAFATPATMTDAPPQGIALQSGMQLAQINVQIGPDRRRWRERRMHRQRCTTTVVYRNGRRTVIKRCR